MNVFMAINHVRKGDIFQKFTQTLIRTYYWYKIPVFAKHIGQSFANATFMIFSFRDKCFIKHFKGVYSVLYGHSAVRGSHIL